MKPNYDQWAEALLSEIYYAPEDLRAALVKEHLLKAAKRGFVDGTDVGWAYEQDKDFMRRNES